MNLEIAKEKLTSISSFVKYLGIVEPATDWVHDGDDSVEIVINEDLVGKIRLVAEIGPEQELTSRLASNLTDMVSFLFPASELVRSYKSSSATEKRPEEKINWDLKLDDLGYFDLQNPLQYVLGSPYPVMTKRMWRQNAQIENCFEWILTEKKELLQNFGTFDSKRKMYSIAGYAEQGPYEPVFPQNYNEVVITFGDGPLVRHALAFFVANNNSDLRLLRIKKELK